MATVSPGELVDSPRDKNLAIKREKKNAHLISHVWSETINGSLATHLFPLVDWIFPPSNHSWAVLGFYEEPQVLVLKFVLIEQFWFEFQFHIKLEHWVQFWSNSWRKNVQISNSSFGSGNQTWFGVWFWNWIWVWFQFLKWDLVPAWFFSPVGFQELEHF